MPKNTIANRTSYFKKRFLERYSKYGCLEDAAAAAGIASSTVYNWRKGKEFEEQFKVARLKAIEIGEIEQHRRAIDGWEEPVFYKGKKCGTVKKFSDSLLINKLKALDPDKYRERVETKQSGEVTLHHVYDDPVTGSQNKT